MPFLSNIPLTPSLVPGLLGTVHPSPAQCAGQPTFFIYTLTHARILIFHLTVNANHLTTSPCPPKLNLSHCVAFGKPELAHPAFISITIPTPGGMTGCSNMEKVHEPCSKDLSDRLYADNTVNEFNSNELLFVKMWESKDTALRLRTKRVNNVSEKVCERYKNNFSVKLLSPRENVLSDSEKVTVPP